MDAGMGFAKQRVGLLDRDFLRAKLAALTWLLVCLADAGEVPR